MFILWWIIVGLIAGWLTGKIMSGGGYGPGMDIVVGIVGAILGGFIMRSVGFAGQGGLIYSIFVAVIGAVILTLLLRLVTRGSGSSNLTIRACQVLGWQPICRPSNQNSMTRAKAAR